MAFVVCLIIVSSPFYVCADVLFGKSYHETIHTYLKEAETSITVAMYFIILEPKGEGPINELVNDIIGAHNRGVLVKVVLEDSKPKANRLAYEKLKANNIAVYFDTPEHLLHIKGVAVDSRYIFLGSANWSKSAIEDNYEATYFENSPQDALAFIEYVNNIPLQKNDIFLPQTKGVLFSKDFLLSPELGRKLLKAQAYRQFDLYLLLCRIQQESGKSYFDIDYDLLAKRMGYQTPWYLGRYRNEHEYFYERIHRSLKRLKGYGLIDYRKGKVTLKVNDITGVGNPLITIPFEYWEYGYSDKLSMRAKYVYLICLYEASRSTRYPFWFRSQKDMSELYGISNNTISLGLLELEKMGIIEVTRDMPTPPDFADRKANIHRMLPLPSQ
jgi:HKD family nuclease